MNLDEILTSDRIFFNLEVKDKKDLFKKMAEKVSTQTGCDSHLVLNALMEREKLGTTGFGGGCALPHARLTCLKELYCAFFRLQTPIDYDSVDNQKVDLIFLLLVPEEAGADHLKALAGISKVLRDEKMCSKLRSASTFDVVMKIVS